VITRPAPFVRILGAVAILGAVIVGCGQRTPSEADDPASAAGMIEPPPAVAEADEPRSEVRAIVVADAAPRTPALRSAPSAARAVVENAWTPFAHYGDLVLRHPSARVERIGFHESNHDGARQLAVLASAADPMTLETRNRGTGSRSAADVVVDPDVAIRAPATGTVLRAGTYVLYCDYSDGYVVIEPDGYPGLEAKVLHIDGVRVRAGDRVEAGVTVIAGGPTPLPFTSQVDEHTAEPSWPHVHIEVVDTSIPNRPSPGSRC
jgi:hypothetical protein